MQINDFLAKLSNVTGSNGQFSARCPAHDDKRNSLSVSQGEDGRILVHCHAHCSVENIVSSLGLTFRDLFSELDPSYCAYGAGNSEVNEFLYGRNLKKVKSVSADGSKTYYWQYWNGAKWENGRNSIIPPLYKGNAGELTDNIIYIVEGEKDVLTLEGIGIAAISLPDGAKSKWHESYADELRGKSIYIIPDNDEPGRRYAANIALHLKGVAANVKVLDLRAEWEDIPEHYDVTDVIKSRGQEFFGEMLKVLCEASPVYDYSDITEAAKEPKETDSSISSLFRPLTDFEEEEARWLVKGWIPFSQITIIASDGGVGKTTVWSNIVASLSAGRPTILDNEETQREPMKVLICTTEDSIRTQLKGKLSKAGGNMENIYAMDPRADRNGELQDFHFGSKKMADWIREIKPQVVVFDPIQAFVPAELNMGSRNAMRHCMSQLGVLADDLGITFILIAHTNKRKDAYGRGRISDSADLWDFSRSVIMLGTTPDANIRYISNEKNNYARLAETILFSINSNGEIEVTGTSPLRDQDYVLNSSSCARSTKRERCVDWIFSYLMQHDGQAKTSDLKKTAKAAGFTEGTIRRAEDLMKEQGTLEYSQHGNGKSKEWSTFLTNPVFTEQFDNSPSPFDVDVQLPSRHHANTNEALSTDNY